MNKKTFSKTVCRVLFFSVFFFFLFIKADFVSAFSCSSGTLDTTCYVNNVQAISNGETISGTGNLIIQNGGNLTATGEHFFTINMGGDVTVQEGGQITGNLSNLTATNLTIAWGAVINNNSLGYAGGVGYLAGGGPGGGSTYSDTVGAGGGGGAYGGDGGWGRTWGNAIVAGGATYGSLSNPINLGSGGGGARGTNATYPTSANGGAGGGAVRVTVSGTTTLSGSISVNGGNGTNHIPNTSYCTTGGGGAGGSVWITTGILQGEGTITATGGNMVPGTCSANNYGGGGAGGRVAIYYTTSTFTGTTTTYGGTGHTQVNRKTAEDGTVYIGGTNYALFKVGAPIVIAENSGVEIVGNVKTALAEVRAVNLTIPLGMSISTSIRGDRGGEGYVAGTGTGGGATYSSSVGAGGGGGGYGGNGGNGREWNGASVLGGIPHGSMLNPVDIGSGGGGARGTNATYPTSAVGGAGGGSVRIIVPGTITVTGSITANGENGNNHIPHTSYCTTGGGGAGGSIWITTGTLAGQGSITANGGNMVPSTCNSNNYAGGGGGGRVALYYTTKTHDGVLSSYGGTGHIAGGAGTIYTKANIETYGDLLLDNNHYTGITTQVGAHWQVKYLTIRNRADLTTSGVSYIVTVTNDLAMSANATMNINGPITVGNNMTMASSNYLGTTTLNVAADLTLSSSSSATINSGGTAAVAIVRDLTLSSSSMTLTNTIANTIGRNFSLTSSNYTMTGGLFAVVNNTTFATSNVTINSDEENTIGNDLALSGITTFILSKINVGNDVTIGESSNMRQRTANTNGLQVVAGGDFDLQWGGSLNNDYLGYSGGKTALQNGSGTGGGIHFSENVGAGGGGGAYGGDGGDGSRWLSTLQGGTGLRGESYGSLENPINLGSGGGSGKSYYYGDYTAPGGNGGGAIRVTVTGATTISGLISANGEDGGCSYRDGSYNATGGGGSGGSVWITTGSLLGAGSITTDGGDRGGGSCHASNYAGGGGGGRVAIYYNSSTFIGTTTTYKGIGHQATSWREAEDGTVYIGGTNYALFKVGSPYIIAENSGIEIVGNVIASVAEVRAVNLTVPLYMSISTNKRGYAGGRAALQNGSGTGGGIHFSDYVGSGGGGGAYGGGGGDGRRWPSTLQSGTGLGGSPYGSMTNPSDFGSGGGTGKSYYYGDYTAPGGNGGGSVRIIVPGIMTVTGAITANGEDGACSYRDGSYNATGGGGSGGSIWVTAGTIAGQGSITADGGDRGGGSCHASNYAGGGGGGRVALYYCEELAVSLNLSASGGIGYGNGGVADPQIYTELLVGADCTLEEECTTVECEVFTGVEPIIMTDSVVRIRGTADIEYVFVGNLVHMGDFDSVETWFKWGSTTNSMSNITEVTTSTRRGLFSSKITFVAGEVGNTYYVRAVAKLNEYENLEADETLSFTVSQTSGTIITRHGGEVMGINVEEGGVIEVVRLD